MAPPAGSVQTLLSPAELSFLHSSLALAPPIRPDLRSTTQFRPLIAETDILSSANGSARICFSDGTEAIAGVKAEIEKTKLKWQSNVADASGDIDMGAESDQGDTGLENKASHRPNEQDLPNKVLDSWLEVSIEIPGFRDDDNLPVFLSSLLGETLRADSTLLSKLWINERWHWKLYIDILSLSPPLSYPLPLLSLTTHLALLNTFLPRLTSEPSDDPLFDDDWAAAIPMYPKSNSSQHSSFSPSRPPITLLVMTVAENIIFDPSKEELAVADSVLAVSVVPPAIAASESDPSSWLKLIAIRFIDPPSRLTPPGIPNSLNPATDPGSLHLPSSEKTKLQAETAAEHEALVEKNKNKLWTPPRGGIKRALIAQIIKLVTEPKSLGFHLLEGLASVKV